MLPWLRVHLVARQLADQPPHDPKVRAALDHAALLRDAMLRGRWLN
ncbi:MAG: hypothetical protein FJ027_05115 [Candidatus Rokubacteria bacterium]|nr:hypothetical protein [Candidatus Rokubacteria bacterium]